MSNIEQLRRKLGYIPDLISSDFSVFSELSNSEIETIATTHPANSTIVRKAQVYRTIQKAMSNGDSCSKIDFEFCENGTNELDFTDVTFVNEFAFLTEILKKEESVLKNLIRIGSLGKVHQSLIDVAKKPDNAFGGNLSTEQMAFFRSSLTNKVTLLSGGPGTGKTTSNKFLINALLNFGLFTSDEIALLGATNRCLSSYSDLSVNVLTVHKALGFNPYKNTFKASKDSPLPFKFIVVDECTMLNLDAFSALFESIPDDAHLILSGDRNQLSSVGVGDTFYDLSMLELGAALKKHFLSKNFRSKNDIGELLQHISGIKKLDKSALSKINFVKSPISDAEFYEKFLKILLRFQQSGLSIITDLQVLSATYKGAGGIININELIHKAITPDSNLIDVGDKVTIGKTNASLNQGEQVVVVDVSKCGRAYGVRKDNGEVIYIRSASVPKLSNCMSIHEAQGSEWNHGLLILNKKDLSWLGFRGVNTAASRFKESVTFYGDVSLEDLFDLSNNPKKTLASIFNYNSISLLNYLKENSLP
jgi:exodeoxyribonuclease V alpha subunit